MQAKKSHGDRTLTVIVTLLVVVGLLTFLSASFALIVKGDGRFGSALLSQLVLGLLGGGVGLFLVHSIPLGLVRKYAPWIFGAGLLATALVFVPGLGLSINGAQRWLDLGVTTVQPSELLKLGYVLYLAGFIASAKGRAESLMQGVLPFGVVTAVVGMLLLLQPDTDTFAVIAISGLAMMFVAGLRIKHMAVMVGCAVLLIVFLLFMRPYLLERVETFLNPQQDTLGAGYQINQALIAVGSGELFGRGFGQSRQKFTYLPEASSDSIFAVYAEEVGFLGAIMLIGLFCAFILRGLWLAARTTDVFQGLIITGLTTVLGFQAFMNIAAMLGLIPVGGLPLPFVSHGGTALFTALIMVGFILNASRSIKSHV